MAKTATAPQQLRKGAKVVARKAMRDVPEGTAGKVTLVTGLTWIRYWVRFENGVALGSIDRKALATPEEWRRHLAGEDDEASGADAGASSDGDVAAAGDAGAGGGGGGVTTPSGTVVPQLLIDRSAAARKRLQG